MPDPFCLLCRAPPAEAEDGGDGAGGAGAGAGQEPWRQHAEHEGLVRVMAWAGIGKSSLVWCPRYGVVYQV